MTTAAVTTGHVTASLTLPDGLDATPAATAAPQLPGGWTLHRTGPERGDCPIVAIEETTSTPSVTAHGEVLRLRLSREAAVSATLAYAVYTALERARQQARKVTIHANAAVSPAGNGVLLLGTKGAGKTSVTLALGERGWTHAGDDLTILTDHDDQLALLPGKPTAAVRPSDPALWHAPKPQVRLAPFLATPAPLRLLVRLTVHPGVPHAHITAATPFSLNERLRLHEALARYISGLPTPLTNPDQAPYGPVWQLDTPALARWRTGLIDRMAKGPYTYLHAPDAQTAADLIVQEMDS